MLAQETPPLLDPVVRVELLRRLTEETHAMWVSFGFGMLLATLICALVLVWGRRGSSAGPVFEKLDELGKRVDRLADKLDALGARFASPGKDDSPKP